MSDSRKPTARFGAFLSALRPAARHLDLKPSPASTASERFDAALARSIAEDNLMAFDNTLGGFSLRSPPRPPYSLSSAVMELPTLSLALERALTSPSLVYLQRLLAAGADPDALSLGSSQHPEAPKKRRLAHRAVELDHSAALWALMAAGACGALADEEGQTPLILSARRASTLCAQALIESDGALDAMDRAGRSALDWALSYSFQCDLMRFPGAGAAELEVSALELSERLPIAMALLEAGASAAPNPHPRGRSASSRLPPLAAALRLQNLTLFKALLKNGADPAWLLNAPPMSDPPPADPDGLEAFAFAMFKSPARKAIMDRAARLAAQRLAQSKSLLGTPVSAPLILESVKADPKPDLDAEPPRASAARSILSPRRGR